MHLKKLMLFVLVTLMLEAGFAASQGSYALSDDGTGASTGIKSLTSAAYDNVSYNSSAIISREESEIAYAPAAVGVGTGYYSSRPLNFGSQIGGTVQIRNLRTGTSMKRDLNYANAVSGVIDVAAEDSTYRHDDLESSSSSTTHMSVSEDITDGQIHVGVLQGSSSGSADSKPRTSLDSITSAWRDPEIEIDEDYVGTYHIEKNMTIEVPYRQVLRSPDWLSCCSTCFGLDNFGSGLRPVSADNVFNCNLAGR